MKKFLFFCYLLFGSTLAFGQSCCSVVSATSSFAALSKDEAFRLSHDEPLPLSGFEAKGSMVSFATPDGATASAYFLPAAKKSKRWLFVYQEWWGLNDHIKNQAEIFYQDLDNVNVIAIDMYDGKVATKREDAGSYMQNAKEERLSAIIKGAISFAGKKAKIASVGWCFGGGLSLKSALAAEKKAVACVMYYGMPVKDVAVLKTLNCEVLGIFAGKEQWISKAIVADFEKNMLSAGKNLTVKSYDAEHAFANPSNPNFDKVASADAYQAAIGFLKGRLGK